MQDEKRQLIPDIEKQPNLDQPRSMKDSNSPLDDRMSRGQSQGTIRYGSKPGASSASTGDSSPKESNSWDGDLGYPDLDDDDTEYRVTWYRWVMVLLYSLFNINCAI